jgi:hypothetical protein
VLLHRAKEKFRSAWHGADVVMLRPENNPPPPSPKPGSDR